MGTPPARLRAAQPDVAMDPLVVTAERSSQGSYLCWDAEIGYAADHFPVALYDRNLLDREYDTFIIREIKAGSPGDPQVFGVRATLTF